MTLSLVTSKGSAWSKTLRRARVWGCRHRHFFAIPPAALPTTLLETGGLGSLIANYPEAFGGPLFGWLMDEVGGPQAMLNMYGTTHGVFGGASGSQSLGLITRGNVPSLSRTGDAPIMPEDVFSYLTPEDPGIRTGGAERAGGVIRILGDTLFSFGKAEFKTLEDATGQEVAATLQALEKVKKEMENRSLRRAVIWGHTDNIRFKRGIQQQPAPVGRPRKNNAEHNS
jgi:hypothetical protein